MRVALITTWGIACGIAEHSAYLKAAIEQTDPTIAIEVVTDLHPRAILSHEKGAPTYDVVLLNYHAALHSQWTPAAIETVQMAGRGKVLVIYHDTGIPNTDQAKGICAAADAVVVHEPGMTDLSCNGPIHYWRMGVPDWTGIHALEDWPDSWSQGRPILGTLGFPLPWKCYTELAEVTRANGWAFLLIAPGANAADIMRWEALNPCTKVIQAFLPSAEAIGLLGACDATAFTYACQNAGQSAAVLLGIAARKPVIAFSQCRQFRALYADPLGSCTIDWTESHAEVGEVLRACRIDRCDPGIVALAEQDSWRHLGPKFAALLRGLADQRQPADLLDSAGGL